MSFSTIIGIDVSKLTLDIYHHQNQNYFQLKNNKEGFKLLINQAEGQSNVLFCFENTGAYSRQLAMYLAQHKYNYVELNPLQVKQSSGIKRGKSDKIDAKAIADYAWLRRESLVPSLPVNQLIIEINTWLAMRNQLIKQRAAVKASLKENKHVLSISQYQALFALQEGLIEKLGKSIEQVESKIDQLLKQDKALFKNFELICSIKGIGKVVAWKLLTTTNNFTRFKRWRQYSSYCGCAPFAQQSGTSLNKPRRVHHYANKEIKSLLTMAALSAIKAKGELNLYYQNRIEKGKNKMSTVNIIRNKLIARAFAVVKRQQPYVDLNKFAA